MTVSAWTLEEAADPAERSAGIVAALHAGAGDLVLARSGAYELQALAAPALVAQTPSRENVWLVSGGARGVTATCIRALAQRQPDSAFLLAGRSALTDWPADIPATEDISVLRSALISAARQAGRTPSLPDIDRQARRLMGASEIRETLRTVEAAGASAVYLAADVSDVSSVKAAVSRALKAYGPITGLVHGAGVLADGFAMQKTCSDLEYVFGPKVEGLLNLLDCLDIGSLRHIAMFSSAAGVFGNPGQSDYAMANAWLNSVARGLAISCPQAVVKSFCWGPWKGGMVDSALAAHFTKRGISLIDPEDGARIFTDQILFGDRREVELVVGDEWTA